jgi:hypothetical protein
MLLLIYIERPSNSYSNIIVFACLFDICIVFTVHDINVSKIILIGVCIGNKLINSYCVDLLGKRTVHDGAEFKNKLMGNMVYF